MGFDTFDTLINFLSKKFMSVSWQSWELEILGSKDAGSCGVDNLCYCLVLETCYHEVSQTHHIPLNNVDCQKKLQCYNSLQRM